MSATSVFPAESFCNESFSAASFGISHHRAQAQTLSGLTAQITAKFQTWNGVSGKRYICSLFDARDAGALETARSYADAVVLAVRRDPHGIRTLIGVGDTGSVADLFWSGRSLAALMAQGVDEFHIHLMAESAVERQTIVRDLLGASLN